MKSEVRIELILKITQRHKIKLTPNTLIPLKYTFKETNPRAVFINIIVGIKEEVRK